MLLGRLVERKNEDALNFTNYFQKYTFNLANITQTAYIFQEKNPAHAYEYECDVRDSEESEGDKPEGPHNLAEYDYGEETFFAISPDGGIYTTPRDFTKWELALQSLLPEYLPKEAFKPQTSIYGSISSDYQNRLGIYYGYEWSIKSERLCIIILGKMEDLKFWSQDIQIIKL